MVRPGSAALIAFVIGSPTRSASAADPAEQLDRLPPGALVRLGSERGKPPRGWMEYLLLPDGKRLFALHSTRPDTRFSRRHFTMYGVDGLKPVGGPVLAETDADGVVGSPVAASADGRRLAAVVGKYMDVYDLATGKRLARVPRPDDYARSVALSGDGKLMAVGGAYTGKIGDAPVTAAVWDVDAGKEVRRVEVLQNVHCDVALSPDGNTLVTSGYHKDRNTFGKPDDPIKLVQIWDVPSGREVARVDWGCSPRSSLVFSPDGQIAAFAAFSPPSVQVVEPRTGRVLHTLSHDKDDTTHRLPAVSPDGKVVALVGKRQTTRWEVATGRTIGTTPRPAGVPADLRIPQSAFDGPDRLVATGIDGRTVVAWDALGGKVLTPPIDGHRGSVTGVAFAPDGQQVLTGGVDGEVCRWDAATGRPAGQLRVKDWTGADFPRVLVSADGRRAFTPGAVYDAASGKSLGEFRTALKPAPFAHAFYPSEDGGAVAVVAGPLTSDKPNHCLIYNADAGKVTAELALPAGTFRVYTGFTPDRKRLVTAVTASVGRKFVPVVTGWDLEAGKKLGETTLPEGGRLMGLAVAGDREVVVGTEFGRVFVIDFEAGKAVREIPDADRVAVEAVTLSPDRKRVAVCQTSRGPIYKIVRVYGTDTGKVRHTIPYPDALSSFEVMANSPHPAGLMAFSPDGTRLAVPVDTSVLVWDLTRFGPDGPIP